MERTTAMIERQPFPGEIGSRWRWRFAVVFEGFIEEMLEAELESASQRGRYDRHGPRRGHRHGHRARNWSAPSARSRYRSRARVWPGRMGGRRSGATRRSDLQAAHQTGEALIAGAYLSGTNTRRVRRALGALFGGAIGKDVVSRAWHKVQTDWEAWQKRDLPSLAGMPRSAHHWTPTSELLSFRLGSRRGRDAIPGGIFGYSAIKSSLLDLAV